MEDAIPQETNVPAGDRSDDRGRLAHDIGAVASEAFERMAAWSGGSPGDGRRSGPGIPTGFVNLDAHVHGMRAGELAVITGPPGSGKSSLALNIAAAAAIRGGDCLLVSLEMDASAAFIRMCASNARVPLAQVLTGSVSEKDWAFVAEASERLFGSGMRMIDDADLTPEGLAAEIAQSPEPGRTPLVVFDGIELATRFRGGDPGKGDMRERAVELKRLARAAGAAVVATVDYGPGHRRRVKDGEGALLALPCGVAGIADTVVHISRPTSPMGPSEVVIAKAQACGPTMTKLCFVPKYFSFFDWADEV